MENMKIYNWEIVTGCERLTEGCDSCPSYWEYLKDERDYHPFFHEERLFEPSKNLHPSKYVVALGSDLFHESVREEEIMKVIQIMRTCEHHWFEVTTKRAERMYCVMKGARFQFPKNVSLAVSVESGEYKWRIDYLRKTRATTKAVSFVPLLGPIGEVDLDGIGVVGVQAETWGFEREMKSDWVEEIERQCKEQRVLFYEGDTDIYKPEGVGKCQEPQ